MRPSLLRKINRALMFVACAGLVLLLLIILVIRLGDSLAPVSDKKMKLSLASEPPCHLLSRFTQ